MKHKKSYFLDFPFTLQHNYLQSDFFLLFFLSCSCSDEMFASFAYYWQDYKPVANRNTAQISSQLSRGNAAVWSTLVN